MRTFVAQEIVGGALEDEAARLQHVAVAGSVSASIAFCSTRMIDTPRALIRRMILPISAHDQGQAHRGLVQRWLFYQELAIIYPVIDDKHRLTAGGR